MGDTLYSIPLLGAPATAFGFASMSDNHGNQLSGYELTCKGKPSVELTTPQWKSLNEAIRAPHWKAALDSGRLDGVIPVLGGMESPLKAECDKLNAKRHQQSGHLTHSR